MKNKIYSKRIADAIKSFLTQGDGNFYFNDQRGLFQFDLGLGGQIKKVTYIVDVRANEYLVYAISPLGVDQNDEKRMTEMANFICRVNSGVVNGNFDLDMRDGEIRYKCFVDCEGITPSAEMVRSSLQCPAAMFDWYGPGIIDILVGGATAEEALEKCWKPSAEEIRSVMGEEDGGEDGTKDGELELQLDPFGAKGGVAG